MPRTRHTSPFARAKLTGMPPDRVAASIASFDFLYISELVKRGLAAPSVGSGGGRAATQGGGAVFEPQVGIHRNVWVCDFKSLYPSIIRTFNIDPLGYVRAARQDNPIRTQDGTAFARDIDGHGSILPGLLDTFFPQREAAKRRGDAVASQAIKILMNSFYGVLGTPACRFYNPAIANAITGQGRYLLAWSRDWFNARGYEVLYGDTDSVFVASGLDDVDRAQGLASDLIDSFNADLAAHLADAFQVESKLEMEFEKLYTQLFLARARGGAGGARKRYAGVRYGEENVDFVGMEVVRRDWTDLAKAVQRNLFERLFSGSEVAEYLATVVADLRAGLLNRDLVYRKGLRKEVSAYTANVPPHVQAVRKSQLPPPRVVEYVMTAAGPERVDDQQHRVDLEHYLEKQIRPVAEPVLEALQLDFDQVIGDDRQIELF
ncbi:MAG: DNA polymerase domain-containing protein [Pseudomonadota bacterium]